MSSQEKAVFKMKKYSKYFEFLSSKSYSPVYAITTNEKAVAVLTNRNIFLFQDQNFEKATSYSLLLINSIDYDKKNTLVLKQKNSKVLVELQSKNIDNFIKYLHKVLYRILTFEEYDALDCVKNVKIIKPKKRFSLFFVYSRFVEQLAASKIQLSINSKKRLKRLLRYKEHSIVLSDFDDCQNYLDFLISALKLIPFVDTIVFDEKLSNKVNYVPNIIQIILKTKITINNVKVIKFIDKLPTDIDSFFAELAIEKPKNLLTLSFQNIELSSDQLNALKSSFIYCFEFQNSNFASNDSFFENFLNKDIELLSLDKSIGNQIIPQIGKFINITVLSLLNSGIDIVDVIEFLHKSQDEGKVGRIKYVYLGGNNCSRDININYDSKDNLKFPTFKVFKVNKVNWGDHFLSCFSLLVSSQYNIDFSYAHITASQYEQVFSFLESSESVSILASIKWNGNTIDKRFFNYLQKCDNLRILKIKDIPLDSDAEFSNDCFDSLLSLFKESKKLTRIYMGNNSKIKGSAENILTFSGKQIKRILDALISSSRKISYFDISYSNCGDEGITTFINFFMKKNLMFSKINFDGTNPNDHKKYLELCSSITNCVKTQNNIKVNFPYNDLKQLKKKYQSKEFKKIIKKLSLNKPPKDPFLKCDSIFKRSILTISGEKKHYITHEEASIAQEKHDEISYRSLISFPDESQSDTENEIQVPCLNIISESKSSQMIIGSNSYDNKNINDDYYSYYSASEKQNVSINTKTDTSIKQNLENDEQADSSYTSSEAIPNGNSIQNANYSSSVSFDLSDKSNRVIPPRVIKDAITSGESSDENQKSTNIIGRNNKVDTVSSDSLDKCEKEMIQLEENHSNNTIEKKKNVPSDQKSSSSRLSKKSSKKSDYLSDGKALPSDHSRKDKKASPSSESSHKKSNKKNRNQSSTSKNNSKKKSDDKQQKSKQLSNKRNTRLDSSSFSKNKSKTKVGNDMNNTSKNENFKTKTSDNNSIVDNNYSDHHINDQTNLISKNKALAQNNKQIPKVQNKSDNNKIPQNISPKSKNIDYSSDYYYSDISPVYQNNKVINDKTNNQNIKNPSQEKKQNNSTKLNTPELSKNIISDYDYSDYNEDSRRDKMSNDQKLQSTKDQIKPQATKQPLQSNTPTSINAKNEQNNSSKVKKTNYSSDYSFRSPSNIQPINRNLSNPNNKAELVKKDDYSYYDYSDSTQNDQPKQPNTKIAQQNASPQKQNLSTPKKNISSDYDYSYFSSNRSNPNKFSKTSNPKRVLKYRIEPIPGNDRVPKTESTKKNQDFIYDNNDMAKTAMILMSPKIFETPNSRNTGSPNTLSLNRSGKSLSPKEAHDFDIGNDIDLPDTFKKKITHHNGAIWRSIDQKFSLNNIISDVRSNK